MKKSLFLLLLLGALGHAAFAATVTWDNDSTDTWAAGVSTADGTTYNDGDTMVFDGTSGTVQVGTVAPGGIQATHGADVTLSGGTLSNSSGLTLSGESDCTLTIDSDVSGAGNITVSSGYVAFSGSRQETGGTITISSGATLDAREGTLFHTAEYAGSGALAINGGTLIVNSMAYASGNLGCLKDNTGSLSMNGDGATISIQESGTATIGLRLDGWGNNYYLRLAEGKNFTWKESGTGNMTATNSGSGNGLHFDTGAGSTFTVEKTLVSGINIHKDGEGELVLHSQSTLSGGVIFVNGGTLSLAVDEALGAQAGLGQINVSSSASLDLQGHVSYNDINLSAGGTLLNAQNNRGTVYLAVTDEEQNRTELNSQQLATIGGTLSTTGTLGLTLEEDLTCTQSVDLPDWYAGGGRLSGAEGVDIIGSTGAESVAISGYTSALGAVSSSEGGIVISGVENISFDDNHATTGDAASYSDFFRAGALAAGDTVSLEAAGNISFTRNSVGINPSGGGAIYAGNDATLSAGGDIILTDNAAGISEEGEEWISGGAIHSDMGTLTLEAANITVSGNVSGGEGGALYAGMSVILRAEGDIQAEQNAARGSSGGFAYATDAVELVAGGDITLSGNSSEGYGGAVYTMGFREMMEEGTAVIIRSDGGSVLLSGNSAAQSGGAIQTDYSVDFSGTFGTVTLENNSAEWDGGAVDALNILLSNCGDVRISGNTAEGTGGAFSLLSDGELTLEASRGNITFTNNEDSTGANDVTFQGSGTARLTAQEGRQIQMDGGMNSTFDDTVSVLINENGEGGTILLGGTSDIVADTTVNGGALQLQDGAVYGREESSGVLQVTNATLSTDGEATIHAQEATITDSVAEQVTLTVAEQVALTRAELRSAHLIGTGDSSTLTMESAIFTLSNPTTLTSHSTALVAEGFSIVQGTLELQATEEFLQALVAQGGSLDITLFDDIAQVGEEGLTISISDSLNDLLLHRYAAEGFGFVDENGELVNSLTLTEGQILATLSSVEFKITKLIPEPTTATLSLLALAGLCLRRRRR